MWWNLLADVGHPLDSQRCMPGIRRPVLVFSGNRFTIEAFDYIVCAVRMCSIGGKNLAEALDPLFAWRGRREEHRVSGVRFVRYGNSVSVPPMVWGSLILLFVTKSEIFSRRWPLLIWFMALVACLLTVMCKLGILTTCIPGVADIQHRTCFGCKRLKHEKLGQNALLSAELVFDQPVPVPIDSSH